MSKKKDKPLTMDEAKKLLSVFKDGLTPPTGYKFTRYLDGKNPGKVYVSPSGAGQPKKIEDDIFIPLIEKCIKEEIIDSGYKEFSFVTKKGKIKPTPISEYILTTNIGEKYEDYRQIVRRVKKILPTIPGVKKVEDKYFKKGH